MDLSSPPPQNTSHQFSPNFTQFSIIPLVPPSQTCKHAPLSSTQENNMQPARKHTCTRFIKIYVCVCIRTHTHTHIHSLLWVLFKSLKQNFAFAAVWQWTERRVHCLNIVLTASLCQFLFFSFERDLGLSKFLCPHPAV